MGPIRVVTRKVVDPDLEEVLRPLWPIAGAWEWRIGPGAEGEGPAADAEVFFGWQDRGEWVGSDPFHDAVGRGVELHSGEVRGRRRGETQVLVILRAKRGQGWEVETHERAVREALQAAFPSALAQSEGVLRIPPGPLTAGRPTPPH